MYKLVSTQPKHERRYRHQDARQAKRRPGPLSFQQIGREQVAGSRPDVDRKVEPTECLGQQALVLAAKLITHVRRDARLDASGANGNENQTQKKPSAGLKHCRAEAHVAHRDARMTDAIAERKD